MAHYAEIDDNNIVTRVLVVGDDQENRGPAFLADALGLGGIWKKTSYNTKGGVNTLGGTPLHKNYAGIGYAFDGTGFHPPKCHDEATLNTETYLWDCTSADHDIKEIEE